MYVHHVKTLIIQMNLLEAQLGTTRLKKRIFLIKYPLMGILLMTFGSTKRRLLLSSSNLIRILLIYDDAKLDDLLIIKNEFGDNPKIKIIKNNENLGAGISRNIGINHAKGEIIAFIDADDWWAKNYLSHFKSLQFCRRIKFFK